MAGSEPDFNRLPTDAESLSAAERAAQEAEKALLEHWVDDQDAAQKSASGIKSSGVHPPLSTYTIRYMVRDKEWSTDDWPREVKAHWVDHVPGFIIFHTPDGTYALNSQHVFDVKETKQ